MGDNQTAPVHVGVIGAGMICKTYLRSLTTQFDMIKVAAVADLNEAAADRIAAEFQLRSTTVDALLADETIEIILNLTPPAAHGQVIQNILKAGKHAYTEKCFALNTGIAGDLCRLADEKGKYLGCAPDTFFSGWAQNARRIIDSGVLGVITSFAMVGNRDNERMAALSVDELCPIFLPFIMASNVHPNAMSSFVGISNFHTRRHLTRSVFEGVAFSHRHHLEKLLATRDKPVKAIRLAGGVGRSKLWTQMFADVMKLPVEVVPVNETGALGCAIIGAAATGKYPGLVQAANSMCRISAPIVPNEAHGSIYDKKYALYQAAIQSLDSLWGHIQQYKDSQ